MDAVMDAAATRIQRIIHEVDQEPTCGRIVGLRRNCVTRFTVRR
jgi:hypothetical protein